MLLFIHFLDLLWYEKVKYKSKEPEKTSALLTDLIYSAEWLTLVNIFLFVNYLYAEHFILNTV